MKVAIVMPLAELRGGGEMSLLQLMKEGRGKGIEWQVLFFHNGPLAEKVADLGVPIHILNAGRLREPHIYLRTIKRISSILRRQNIKAVISWMGYAQLYGGVAAAIHHIPSILHHLDVPSTKNWIDWLAFRIPVTGVVTVSKMGFEAQQRMKPLRPGRLVYPGAELDRFIPTNLPSPSQIRRRLNLPLEGPLIGMVGRLQRWKGMHTLINAMPAILKAAPDAHSVIVGGDHAYEADYPAFLHKRVNALGLGKRVLFAGLQENVPEWMQAMDVVVHASDREPFGIVVIEAMALGKPVVAGAEGGPAEIITPGVNGLLAPYGDAITLADSVVRYISCPDFAKTVGEKARLRSQDFSSFRYSTCFIQAVNELCQKTDNALIDLPG